MAMPDNRLPRWAPRVEQSLVRRFYEDDARGLLDAELVDEVGCALLARCESFVAACRACGGEVACPCCERIVPRQEVLRCECGWELPWADYFATIQHKQLSGAEPVLAQFREFAARFADVPTLRERILLIDRLIHGFHVFIKTGSVTRPVAVNLIEGRLGEVVAFLDALASGEGSTPGVAETKAAWREGVAVHGEWYRARATG